MMSVSWMSQSAFRLRPTQAILASANTQTRSRMIYTALNVQPHNRSHLHASSAMTCANTRLFGSLVTIKPRPVLELNNTHPSTAEVKDLQAFVTNLEGDIAGITPLSNYVFGAPPRKDLIHRVVVWQLARRRSGTAHVLGRGEVRGSTRKIVPQKGRGRARHGSLRAPQFRTGGVVHGPTNMRKYDFALPKKIRAAGLRAALTIKYLQGHLTIVNEVKNATHRTNPIAHKLEQRGHHKGNTVLVVCGDTMGRELQLATLNIPYAHFMSYKGINVYDIMAYKNVILSMDAVRYLEERRFALYKRF